MADAEPKRTSQHTFTLGALGVVFGDIGTSPLYAFRESFTGHQKLPVDALHALSVLSMLVWALILVVTLKYVFVTMRADNRGEGGSLALLALIQRVTPNRHLYPTSPPPPSRPPRCFTGTRSSPRRFPFCRQ